MKQFNAILCAILLAGNVMSCTSKSDPVQPRIKMETSKGVIVIELNPQAAPKTTANFLAYVKSGFYDGTIFHRVIKGFMIQGGGMTVDMKPKPTLPPVVNEADNQLKNSEGTIAMARTGDPDSATSQFFINTKNNPFLDHTAKTQRGWGYCVFGRVVQGMDVVHAIENVKTGQRSGYSDVPVDPVVINKVSIEEKSASPKTDAKAAS